MLGLLVGPVADVGVRGKTLELAPEAAIITTGLPPRLLLSRGGNREGARSARVPVRLSRVKKSQNPSFRAGRTPLAETRVGGRQSVPNTPPTQRVQPTCSVPADYRTNYPTEDSRAADRAARRSVRGLVHATVPLPLVDLPDSTTHLDGDLAVALEPLELSGSLLDDLMLDEGSDLLSGERDVEGVSVTATEREANLLGSRKSREPRRRRHIAGGKRTRQRPRLATTR